MSNWRQLMPDTRAYLMGKVLYQLHHTEGDLEKYLDDPDAYLNRFGLEPDMARAIRDNDVAEIYKSGVNPYLLRAHCIGVNIPEDESLKALRSVLEENNHNG
ncbi:subunit of meta cleavage enzyme [Cucumibacter marinus]|uniref:subunit of meta cleavage enzyme n=1 Tax=Cucumibacter marinus TaxID=1121252 RepID=UPI000420B2BD|nr:subunit of meta cleavage enzyme [Cucumibacter marinus]